MPAARRAELCSFSSFSSCRIVLGVVHRSHIWGCPCGGRLFRDFHYLIVRDFIIKVQEIFILNDIPFEGEELFIHSNLLSNVLGNLLGGIWGC